MRSLPVERLYTSFVCSRSSTLAAKTPRKDPSDRRILGLVSASRRCWGLSVPDNASEARTVWSGRKAKETQLYMHVKWWWNTGRVLQWAVPHPSGSSQEKKIPAVFMTSATHTGILIAASLLRGEEIDYLKASPNRPHFHVRSFFLSLLSDYSVHQVISPSCITWFSPTTTSNRWKKMYACLLFYVDV